MAANKINKPEYSSEEIELLEQMQGDLARMYKRVVEIETEHAKYDESSWSSASTLANLRDAAGSCATGYATVTETLKKAKMEP